MYAKLNNGQVEKYPYTIGQLRKDHHNVSFPKVMTDEIFAQFGVVRVTPTPRPEYNHTKEFNVVAEQVNGAWVEKWVATDVSAEEIAQRTENQAKSVRASRDDKLKECDWVVTKAVDQNAQDSLGIQIPVVWLNYRQALRDVPAQAGFPWDITWPDAV